MATNTSLENTHVKCLEMSIGNEVGNFMLSYLLLSIYLFIDV